MNKKTQSTIGKALKAEHIFVMAILFLTFSFGAVKSSAQSRGLSGTWRGTYTCAQGLTNLNLAITQRSSSRLSAVFNFSANKSNPTVPSGSYRMRGIYNKKTRRITLKATRWINHPADYQTVNLAGYVYRSNNRISGKVLNSACSDFRVFRR